jgi:hypothetical protein
MLPSGDCVNKPVYRPLLLNLAVFALYGIIACLITYPLITQMGSHLAGFPYGDAQEDAHHLWWMTHALQTGQPLFEQPLLGYPDGLSGFTLRSNLLQYFPGWLFHFILPLPAAFNLHLLVTLALNGWAMFVLARHLVGRVDVALLAGAAYLCFPTMQGHIGAAHIGLLAQYPLPLVVWSLLNLNSRPTWRNVPLTTGLFILCALGHTPMLIYTMLPVTAFFALRWLWARQWHTLRLLLIACALGTLLLGWYLFPILSEATGSVAEEGGSVRYSADLLAVVSPSFFHPLYSGLAYPRQVLGINLDEGAAYLGIVVGALALLGLWRQQTARVWLGLAAVAWLLSLGPLLKILDQPAMISADGYQSHIALPWLLLQDLPLFNLVRTPARFNFALALAVVVMAAYGAAWLLARLRPPALRTGVAIALTALIIFDYQVFFPLPTTPATLPAEIVALRQRPNTRAVFNIPWDNLIAAKEALYLQTAHQLPMIAGQVTRRTPVSPALLTLLEETLDPSLLDEAAADLIVVHRQHIDAARLEAMRGQLGAVLFEDERFVVFERPQPAVEAPTFITLPLTSASVQHNSSAYTYTSTPAWALLTTTLVADGREASLTLDGHPLWQGVINGETTLQLPLLWAEARYGTLQLALVPPCPAQIPAGQVCRSLNIQSWTIDSFLPLDGGERTSWQVNFERGLTLRGSLLLPLPADEDSLSLWLWWHFARGMAESDVRFVHVLDTAGQIVSQQDVPLGSFAEGQGWSEAVTLPLPSDLPAGDYTVVTGWYTFPDLTRWRVQSPVELTAVEVGTFRIEPAQSD